jgi:hypothetical protein
MPYKFIVTVALSTAICAGTGLATAASARDLSFERYRDRTTPQAVRRSLLPGNRLGSAHRGAGIAPPPRLGSPGPSGWYHPGFGGTYNPGWGYNFGPNLGGLGR